MHNHGSITEVIGVSHGAAAFWLDALSDALVDSVKMLPFLFLAYLLIEYLEQRSARKLQGLLAGFGRFGPLGGALLGCVPQCGFSAAAANFYSNRLITLGTLIAVFVSTSDEAVPMLLSRPDSLGTVALLLGCKVVLAFLAGMLVDITMRSKPEPAGDTLHHKHEHCHDHGSGRFPILRPAIRHTVQIFLFILAVSFALNAAIGLIGEETLSKLLLQNSLLQPLAAALVGFIPNCAASVLLTGLYMDGAISFGACVAGLSTGAGIGLAVLLRENRSWRDNARIIGILYLVGAGAGVLLQLIFA